MSELTQQTLLVPLIVFCRVGACFMVLPGFSSDRIPVQLRLFVAIAISLAIMPIVYDDVRPVAAGPAEGPRRLRVGILARDRGQRSIDAVLRLRNTARCRNVFRGRPAYRHHPNAS